jgi:hypothetical protein
MLRSPFKVMKGAFRKVNSKNKADTEMDASKLPTTVLVDHAAPIKSFRYLDDSGSTDPTSGGTSLTDQRRFSDFSIQGEDVRAKLGRAGISDFMIEALRREGLIITDAGRDGD